VVDETSVVTSGAGKNRAAADAEFRNRGQLGINPENGERTWTGWMH
jgi:hypothetical protein